MGRVFIDEELVEFDGPPPAGGAEVCQLIEGFLAGQGRVVASVAVDGEECSLERAAERSAYETISFVTTTPERQLLDMCAVWSAGCGDCIDASGRLASACLRSHWQKSQSEVVGLLEAVRPVIEGLDILRNYGAESEASWSQSFGECFESSVGAIDKVADAVEAGSPVLLSDALAGPMLGGWTALRADLDGVVRPAIEGGLSS